MVIRPEEWSRKRNTEASGHDIVEWRLGHNRTLWLLQDITIISPGLLQHHSRTFPGPILNHSITTPGPLQAISILLRDYSRNLWLIQDIWKTIPTFFLDHFSTFSGPVYHSRICSGPLLTTSEPTPLVATPRNILIGKNETWNSRKRLWEISRMSRCQSTSRHQGDHIYYLLPSGSLRAWCWKIDAVRRYAAVKAVYWHK